MSKTRILIAEDELIVARDISQQLAALGYETVGMTNRGDEALALAEQHRPDLVLMDIQLEGPIDGVEAARSLRELQCIPVVFLTALAAETALARAKTAGPFGYIVKPFEERELHTAIEVALNLHHAEARLRTSQARSRMLSRAVEQSPVSIVITDSEGTIEYVNPYFTRVTGYSAAEALGRNPRVLKSGEQTADFYREMWKAISGGHEWTGDFHNRRKDGSLFWEHASISPVRDDAGVVTHFVAVKEDVTSCKESQRQLLETQVKLQASNARLEASVAEARRLTEAAEAANQAKSAFLATMSHELRTPLNVINGVSATLLDQDPTEAQRTALDLIHRSGEDLLAIIEKILDFTRLQAGKITLDEQPCELAPAVFHALRMAAELIGNRGLDIRCAISPNVPARVVSDARKLGQVLTNLLSNAVKFTEYGHVELQLDADREADAGWLLTFTVKDTGIGIEPATLERLFQPFSQADGSITRRYGGSGLGLAISRSLAQLMGGDITVESVPGEGSTFRFTARVRPTGDDATLISAGRVRSLEGKRAMVAAAHASHGSFYSTLLTAWGMHVAVLDNALSLPGVFGVGEAFDVLLVEAEALPAGLRAYWDRLHVSDGGTPVVWISAERGVAPSAAGPHTSHLPWPFSPDELQRTLLDLLQPSKVPATESRRAAAAGRESLSKRLPLRILAADDVRINREVLRMILHHLGYKPDFVEDGAEVLAALAQRTYDLVLLDVQMPVMDGLTAAREICRLYPHEPTRPRLVAITANALPEARGECLAAGMNDYLSKPVVPRQLEACIVKLFQAETPPAAQPSQSPTEAAPSAPKACIDPDHLALITACRSPDETAGLVDQLVASFQADFQTLLPRLRQACTHRDAKAAALLVHGLKGGALTLGWTQFAEVCVAALTALRAGSFGDWERLCPELERSFFESHHATIRYLHSLETQTPCPQAYAPADAVRPAEATAPR